MFVPDVTPPEVSSCFCGDWSSEQKMIQTLKVFKLMSFWFGVTFCCWVLAKNCCKSDFSSSVWLFWGWCLVFYLLFVCCGLMWLKNSSLFSEYIWNFFRHDKWTFTGVFRCSKEIVNKRVWWSSACEFWQRLFYIMVITQKITDVTTSNRRFGVLLRAELHISVVSLWTGSKTKLRTEQFHHNQSTSNRAALWHTGEPDRRRPCQS